MNKQHLNRVVDRAKEIFVRSERNLTEKGRGVLEFLLEFPTYLYRTTKPLVLTIKEPKKTIAAMTV